MKNVEVREPNSMPESVNYWKSLWGEKHSIMKEQNGYEGKREGKLVIWIRSLYRLQKLLYICQKLTIESLLEMIKLLLKAFPATHGILQKTSMQ
jgi:hypothetical protein